MTDRELLELAAKAAGIKKNDSPYNGGGYGNDGFDCMGNMVLNWHNNEKWNPLTNDGDALRLAVQLSIDVLTPDDDNKSGVFYGTEELWEDATNDPYAATRRAIVRAAAEIGK